ncbi:MAG: hypothetical protein U0990_09585 [Candidatus Nanopelagicales bacterium]|nr:hypothetical protein [Candidatus Nanopelagicales bacterium]
MIDKDRYDDRPVEVVREFPAGYLMQLPGLPELRGTLAAMERSVTVGDLIRMDFPHKPTLRVLVREYRGLSVESGVRPGDLAGRMVAQDCAIVWTLMAARTAKSPRLFQEAWSTLGQDAPHIAEVVVGTANAAIHDYLLRKTDW